MDRVHEAWDNIMDRFGSKWNVIALDLKNEPQTPGELRWWITTTNTTITATTTTTTTTTTTHPCS